MLGAAALRGQMVCLEPLRLEHAPDLARAAEGDRELYRWSPVPQGLAGAQAYISAALEWQAQGTAVPYAIVRSGEGVVGSTRFWNIETWPASADPLAASGPSVAEIGYSWLSAAMVRAGVNREAKLLMLTHAFEVWRALRICFHTDVRNQRSRTALERLGARFEGVLRVHRVAADGGPRDSARYSISAAEWPDVKSALVARLGTR